MTSPFDNAIAVGQSTVAAIAGRSIVYKRGVNSVTIDDAVPGDEFRGSLVEAGVSVESQSRDWLIEATKINIPNVGVTLPEQGDLIEEVVEGKTCTYEIMPLFNGDVPWRWSDRGQTRVRVHTRLKGVT